uniref:Uncharacterized protein n=1 Tax=Aureoumbra lagunensis TaxID=44058 RepID=A0A7S3JWI8_9STRA|mmetsp:Transcript_16686/g.25074  ORF Transcript_16686/g.25074 Transcript_16686/m.25074 type:complete len:452 (+) Transcript_16686:37-1392(+)
MFFEGRWRAVKTEGEFEPFLRDRGVPFPIRKMIRLMSNGGKFEFAIKNGAYVETEIGRFSNKVNKPIPLDGKTGINDKSPAGEEIIKYAKIEGENLILTNVMKKDQDDAVDAEVWAEGNGLRKRMTNRKFGTSFTVFLEPLYSGYTTNNNSKVEDDSLVNITTQQQSKEKEERMFFEGQWRAVDTQGDFDQFMYDRGVPFPIRKMIRLMSNGGTFEFVVKNGAYVEIEIGRFSNKVHKPIPIGTNLKGVPDKSPAGEPILKYATIHKNEQNQDTLLLTNAMQKDEDDCVDAQVWKTSDGLLKKCMTNRKYGSSFTVTLEPLHPILSPQQAKISSSQTSSTAKSSKCYKPSSTIIHGVQPTSGGHFFDVLIFSTALLFFTFIYRSLLIHIISFLSTNAAFVFSQIKALALFILTPVFNILKFQIEKRTGIEIPTSFLSLLPSLNKFFILSSN